MTNDNNKIIQSLWIGKKLSIMERLCIQSFLKNGHDFHLYTYEQIENIPDGTVVMDANEIIPAERIFTDTRNNSLAGFSDWFRYKLLYDRGGWWVDMDMICIKYLDIKDDYCFAYDLQVGHVQEPIASGIFKSPQKAEYLADLLEYIALNPVPPGGQLTWFQIGPKLLDAAVTKYVGTKYARQAESFFPVGWFEIYKFVSKQESFITEKTYTVHLSNSFWGHGSFHKEATYHPDSFYEQIKKTYDVQ